MKHLGDITKIKGCVAPVVDCIIGGSPCQDLSVAGKRAGLAGERSGLYMEQIRIIKEMRHKDEQHGRTGESIRPRYMVWENVPGAFSSNKGKDFAAVLEEAIKVADPEAPDVPVPEKGWPTSGCIMGDTWSVAWRVLDAQFWGVPQRRRRIALVADFGGQSAPEILFIRKGVSRDLDESESARKATAGDAKSGTGADDRNGVPYTLKIRSGVEVDSGGKSAGKGALIQTNKTGTLSTVQDQYLFQPVATYNIGDRFSVPAEHIDMSPTLTARMGTGGNNVPAVTYPTEKYLFENHSQDSRYKGPLEVSPMLSAQLGTGGNNTPLVCEPVTLEPGIASREGGHIYEGVSGTLRANAGDNQMAVAYSINHQGGNVEQILEEKTGTLTAAMNSSGNNKLSVAHPVIAVDQAVVYGIQGSMIGRADHNGPQGDGVNEDVSFTLNTTDRHAVCYNIGSYHSNAWKSDNPNSGVYEADKSKTLDALQCGYPGCNQGGTAVVETYQKVTGPLMANSHPGSYTGQDAYSDMLIAGPVGTYQETGIGWWNNEDVGATLRAMSGGDAMKANLVVAGVDCRNATEYEEQTGSLQSSACHNMNSNNVVRVRYIVRRLTPLECERLQGYPDGWTDIGEWLDSKGKKHKEADSPRYKALGNSIAIPPWKWVLKRLCACYERDATMASLFDGIGGFPYIWEQLNGKGSCLWASEIEEFPMAVTKLRFGGNDNEGNA